MADSISSELLVDLCVSEGIDLEPLLLSLSVNNIELFIIIDFIHVYLDLLLVCGVMALAWQLVMNGVLSNLSVYF